MRCTNCGAEVRETDRFCGNCGAVIIRETGQPADAGEPFDVQRRSFGLTAMHEDDSYGRDGASGQEPYGNPAYGRAPGQEPYGNPVYGRTTPPGDASGIKERSVILGIVFSFISCGFYSIYWMYCCNNEINQLSGDTEAVSGGWVILFTFITMGIYGIYWAYQMGRRNDRITGRDDKSHILFVVLSILGLSIVVMAIMQDNINKAIAQQ